MANATIRRLATEYALPGEALIDDLVKKSGFLKTAQVILSNQGYQHKYKKVSALPTASIRSRGGSVTDQTVNDELANIDLKLISVAQSEPKEICDELGVANYFKRMRPSVMEAIGQKASNSVFYGNNSTWGDVSGFLGLHQIAKAAVRTDSLNSNSNVIQAGGTTAYRSTIFAVKFQPEKCGFVINGKRFGAGNLIETTIFQPAMEVTNTTTGAKKPVYQVLYEMDAAFLSTSFYDVAAMTQIQDDDNDRPTVGRMNLLCDLVHAESDGTTILYMNRTAYRLVQELKNTKLVVYTGDKDYNTAVDTWEGIPIVIDDNLSAVETNVLD